MEAVLFVDMCIYECRCLLLVTYDVERRECKRVDRRRLRSIRDRTRERARECVQEDDTPKRRDKYGAFHCSHVVSPQPVAFGVLSLHHIFGTFFVRKYMIMAHTHRC